MPRKSPKKVLSTEQLKPNNVPFEVMLRYILLFISDVFLLFTTRIPLNFFRWIVMVVVRGYILSLFCIHSDKLIACFPMDRTETFTGMIYDFFIVVPIIIFLLWYFFTTLTMFLAPFYAINAFGGNTGGYVNYSSYNSSDYSEINRFIGWRDNKMKFSSYKESVDLMKNSAILNNLDQNDPEARKTLDYINNKMRFMSYTESLNFLKGK